jgi:hypothetical protein
MDKQTGESGEASTKDLVVRAIEQGRRLAKAELELARREVREELQRALQGATMLGAGAWLGLGGGLALLTASLLALKVSAPRKVALVGVGLLGGGVLLARQGLLSLPSQARTEPGERVKPGLEALAAPLLS